MPKNHRCWVLQFFPHPQSAFPEWFWVSQIPNPFFSSSRTPLFQFKWHLTDKKNIPLPSKIFSNKVAYIWNKLDVGERVLKWPSRQNQFNRFWRKLSIVLAYEAVLLSKTNLGLGKFSRANYYKNQTLAYSASSGRFSKLWYSRFL